MNFEMVTDLKSEKYKKSISRYKMTQMLMFLMDVEFS